MESSEADLGPVQLRVVLVDARAERRKLMIDVVESSGARAVVVAEAHDLESACTAVAQARPNGVLLDLRMPIPVGLRTVQQLRRTFPSLGIVVCSFDLSAATIHEALLAGADACLRKPSSPYELVGALDTACQRASTAFEPVPTR
jgi:DNA-binding NarL/FixJ family response regulator